MLSGRGLLIISALSPEAIRAIEAVVNPMNSLLVVMLFAPAR
jgi:hypothetical protein